MQLKWRDELCESAHHVRSAPQSSALHAPQIVLPFVIVLLIENSDQIIRWDKNCKKIKEVLTRFPYFGYKRRFILKFKLHFTTAHEKEIHFTIRVF
jgi:hypothetical protein